MKHLIRNKVTNYKVKPAFDVFDQINMRYKKKPKPEGNLRDEHRMARRMRKTNQYDPEVTEERSLPGLTQDK
jgi:hypothetical protein